MANVLNNQRPLRPEPIRDDTVWSFIELCWYQNRVSRPLFTDIRVKLEVWATKANEPNLIRFEEDEAAGISTELEPASTAFSSSSGSSDTLPNADADGSDPA